MTAYDRWRTQLSVKVADWRGSETAMKELGYGARALDRALELAMILAPRGYSTESLADGIYTRLPAEKQSEVCKHLGVPRGLFYFMALEPDDYEYVFSVVLNVATGCYVEFETGTKRGSGTSSSRVDSDERGFWPAGVCFGVGGAVGGALADRRRKEKDA